MSESAASSPVFISFAICYGITVWDWLISLQNEWTRIWRAKRFGLIEGLYVGARYYTLIFMAILLWVFSHTFQPSECRPWRTIVPLGCAISALVCDAVLGIRCWAIWGMTKPIGLVVTIAWLVEVASTIVALIYYKTVPEISNVPGPCIVVGNIRGPNFTLFNWVGSLVFAAVIFQLTTYKAIKLWKQGGANNLLVVLLRDGTAYVLIVFAIYLLNLIFFLQPNIKIQAINAPAAILIPSCIVSRMILNLRDSHLATQHHLTPSSKSNWPFPVGLSAQPQVSTTDIELNARGLGSGTGAAKAWPTHDMQVFSGVATPTTAFDGLKRSGSVASGMSELGRGSE